MQYCDYYLEYRVSERGCRGLERHQVGWPSLPGLRTRLLHNQDLKKLIWDWEENIQILFIILIKAELFLIQRIWRPSVDAEEGDLFSVSPVSAARPQVTQFNLIKAGIWVSPQCPSQGRGGSWPRMMGGAVHLRGLNRDLYWHFSNFALSES